MNSEKVKEIKKALEDNANYEHYNKLGYIDGYKCKTVDYADILTLINELESDNKELRAVVDIANERTYRKKFTDEWRKEYQKELDKQGSGHIAGHPDFDLVYKLYFEQKDRIAELEKENALIKNSVAMRDYKTLEEISNNKVKEFAEKLKNKLFEFFQDNEELDGKISVGPLYVDVIGVKAKDRTIISLGLIDRLLKEYENEKRSNRMA